MTTPLANRWLSDVRPRIVEVARGFSSSDLPMFLVIDGKRIPFVIDCVESPLVDGDYELEIHIRTQNN